MKKEILEKSISIIIAVFCAPLKWWVTFKVYSYFYKDVGFDLPKLTLINIICIYVIKSAIFNNYQQNINVSKIKDKVLKKKKKESIMQERFVLIGLILMFWLISYILKCVIL